MNTTGRDAIRTQLIHQRRTLSPAEQAEAGHLVAASVFEVLERVPTVPPPVVAGYRALPGELDPAEAIGELIAAGWTVVLPVCGEGGSMEFCPWRPGDELVRSSLGIGEPTTDPVSVAAIDAVIVPGAAFDRAGNRLGHGAGFYDRFFARCAQQSHDPYRLGLAYNFQVIDLPAPEPWDIPMHSVVSPSEVIDTSLCE